MAAPRSVEELLDAVKLLLSEALVHQVGACFQFDVSSEDGHHHNYFVDLSQGSGFYITLNREIPLRLVFHLSNNADVRSKQKYCYINIKYLLRSVCVL